MESSLTIVIITIGLALLFDFLNGFHDAEILLLPLFLLES